MSGIMMFKAVMSEGAINIRDIKSGIEVRIFETRTAVSSEPKVVLNKYYKSHCMLNRILKYLHSLAAILSDHRYKLLLVL